MSDNCIIRLYPANFSNWPVASDLSQGWMMSWARTWAAQSWRADTRITVTLGRWWAVTSLWRREWCMMMVTVFSACIIRGAILTPIRRYWCLATPDIIYAGEEMTCGVQTQETVTRIPRILLRHANSDRLGVWRGWFVLPTIVGGVVSVTPGNKY